jgi:murein DD-endopeptidase MepM/ murein hydrolase activator NlpD
MKKAFGCLTLLTGLILGAILIFYMIGYTTAAYVAEQLPFPLDTIAWKWIQGESQQVGHPNGMAYSYVFEGKVIESGSFYWKPNFYSGPTSFRYAIPVDNGYRTSFFGDERTTDDGRTVYHTGIDYGTNYTSVEIYAPMGGQVTHAGWSYFLGWTVVVENDGYQTILGHMCCGTSGKTNTPTGNSTIQVQEGDIIEAGTVLGSTGDTGQSDGIHLHFETRTCEDDGKCTVQNPNQILLPGQDTCFDWNNAGN